VITDCHTHWGICWQEKYPGDPTEWLRILDSYGIGRAILLGHANLHRMDRCKEDNTLIARLRDEHSDRFVPFGTTWVQWAPADALGEAERCLDTLGMAGLKFHPWLQGASVATPVMDDICRLAGDRGKPILFHDGTPCYSLTEQIAGLARRFPETTIILGHAGLLWNWRSAMNAVALPNVWACLCGPHMRAIEMICHAADPTRLLWGSDFGFGFADSIGYRLRLLQQADIDADLCRRILEDNPAQLLGE
jgi:predicted TIM-barrel fold metal-dependent hydrolase